MKATDASELRITLKHTQFLDSIKLSTFFANFEYDEPVNLTQSTVKINIQTCNLFCKVFPSSSSKFPN